MLGDWEEGPYGHQPEAVDGRKRQAVITIHETVDVDYSPSEVARIVAESEREDRIEFYIDLLYRLPVPDLEYLRDKISERLVYPDMEE